VLCMVNTIKSVKTLKKLTQQEVSEWPMVKLVKNRLKEAHGNQEYQGVAISDFNEAVKQLLHFKYLYWLMRESTL